MVNILTDLCYFTIDIKLYMMSIWAGVGDLAKFYILKNLLVMLLNLYICSAMFDFEHRMC